MRVQIVATSIAAPARVETAADLAVRVRRSEAWILSRTGVARRHVADPALPEDKLQELAARAVRGVVGDGPPDLLVNASLSPVQLIPDTAPFIQEAMDWSQTGMAAYSIHGTCLSFLIALHNVAALVAAGAYREAIIVSAEIGSVCRDFDEPESCVLIGDGAGAVRLRATPDGESSALLAYEMGTWPEGRFDAEIRGCGVGQHPLDPSTTRTDYLFHMKGPTIYRRAYRKVEDMLDRLFARAGLTRDDVDLVVPHQASGPALGSIVRLGLPAEKTINIIAEYGNCIAASLPMALAVADAEGRLRRGDVVLLMGTGAGLSVAGALIRW